MARVATRSTSGSRSSPGGGPETSHAVAHGPWTLARDAGWRGSRGDARHRRARPHGAPHARPPWSRGDPARRDRGAGDGPGRDARAGSEQARVAVRAAGVSAYDVMLRRSGRLPGTPKVPCPLRSKTAIWTSVMPSTSSWLSQVHTHHSRSRHGLQVCGTLHRRTAVNPEYPPTSTGSRTVSGRSTARASAHSAPMLGPTTSTGGETPATRSAPRAHSAISAMSQQIGRVDRYAPGGSAAPAPPDHPRPCRRPERCSP